MRDLKAIVSSHVEARARNKAILLLNQLQATAKAMPVGSAERLKAFALIEDVYGKQAAINTGPSEYTPA